jgi:hypothetical protein
LINNKVNEINSLSNKEYNFSNFNEIIKIQEETNQKYYLKMDANMEDFAETVGFKSEVIRKP